MELWKAELLAWSEMQKYELDKKGWNFDFFQSKNCLGRCNHLTKEIHLATHFTLNYPEAEVLDTIRHEIAHALCGRAEGHGREWKKMCAVVGCTPERLFKESEELILSRKKYLAECKAGHVSGLHNKPKDGLRYSCSICSSKWNPEHEIFFTLNPMYKK